MKSVFIIFFSSILLIAQGQDINKIDERGMKQGFWSVCSDTSCESGSYLNNKRSGQWVFYKRNQLAKIIAYKNDTLNGYSMSFNTNGSLYRKFFYKNGKLNDKAEFYSKEGVLLARYQYLNDNILTIEYYAVNKESPPRNHGYVPTIE